VTTTPHILVDATAIPANRGGVGRYLEHLLPALEVAGARLSVVAVPRDVGWLTEALPGSHVIEAAGRSRPLRLAWEQTGLPRLAARIGADVIFSPHYTMPLATRVPVVVTLHDATFFSHPEVHGGLKRRFFTTWSRVSLRRAAAAIVPSRATRDELLRWVRPARDRMTVAYHGVDTAVFHPPTPAQVSSASARLGGAARWIAFLGTIEPRKNVGNLVRAFDALATELPDLRLALIGGSGWDAEIDGVVAAAGARDRILRLGFVADTDLAGLLGGAAAVAYPSLGEGFGLPMLEAMASGAPVVTTPFLALPEVGGDVAVYSQPDADSLASALRGLLAETGTDRRERGIQRAKEFSWSASAATHLAVFRSAARETVAA
jgi:glycosyltransferase involved in cell wall biosynthesis